MTIRLIHGDCRQVLKTLADNSVHCCITSPPYWGLRSYLPSDHTNKSFEIGSEPTVGEWVRTMVNVFREVRRVLRPDGTLWLNLGDSYAGSGRGGNVGNGSSGLIGKQTDHSRTAREVSSHQRENCPPVRGSRLPAGMHSKQVDAGALGRAWVPPPAGLKNKDLIGQPWRLAFALQDDGWYLRQDIIWNKRNPMPESVRDRCTKSHEYVFLLSKSGKPTVWQAKDTGEWSYAPDLEQRLPAPKPGKPDRTVSRWRAFDYFYDAEAIKEPASADTIARYARGRSDSHKWAGEAPNGHQQTIARGFGHMGIVKHAERDRDLASAGARMGRGAGWRVRTPTGWATGTDRKHDEVLGRYTQHRKSHTGVGFGHGFDEAPKPRVKNNASFDEAMAAMPSTRNKRSVWTLSTEGFKGAHFATFPPALIEPCVLAGCPEGGTVLDPFGGSGTTGLVCDRHHRNAVLIDLDERNGPMSRERIASEAPLFAEIS